MEIKEHTLTGTANAVLTNDGNGFAFTLMEGTAPLVRLRFALDDMPAFIAHLCQVVAAVHPAPRQSSRSVPLPALSVGLGGFAAPSTSLFSLRLAGMDLDFSMSTETTAELADALERAARTARTLSAAGPAQ